jgi:ATP-dependent Clp endopeptidase proteolytic subunit ClpP
MAKTYSDYPQSATNNAKRALKWVKENGWGSCGTDVGKKRASQIASRTPLSRDTISRVASFKRHQQHKDVPYSEGCGGLMWDCWGGTSMINWAIKKLEEIDGMAKKRKYKYKGEEYDHKYDFTQSDMETLHTQGELYVTQKDEDGTEMTILFTYNDGEIHEHSNIKNLAKMNWYDIKNVASDNVTEVMIYDEIGKYGVDAKSFIDEMKNIPNGTSVLLRINSPGGSVVDGLAIYDAISRMPQKVTTRIEGIAASMGSVIALAGDEVIMSENSLYMIHNVWGGEVGDAGDLRKAADLMDKMGDRLVSIYMSKSGNSEEQIRSWMNEETWFDSSEAVKYGFVDIIEEPIKLAAKFDINKYDYKNKALVNNLFNNIKKESKMEKEFDNLKSFIADLFNKEGDMKEVKILDNDVVVDKMNTLEESIEESNKAIVELNGKIVEKDGYIATLEDEISSYKVAKMEGTPSDVVPSKDPNPTPDAKSEDAWDVLAKSISDDKKVYFKN